MGVLDDIMNSLGFGGASPTPGAPPQAMNGAPPADDSDPFSEGNMANFGKPDPKRLAAERQFYISQGMSPEKADMLIQQPKSERDRAMTNLILRGSGDKKNPGNRAALEKLYPDQAGIIENAPDSALGGIISSLMNNEIKGSGKNKIDRSQLPGALQKYGQYMTDEDISKLMTDDYKTTQENQGGGNAWPRLKGHSLKIVDDDAFKRSGLTSGDTVCIKIP